MKTFNSSDLTIKIPSNIILSGPSGSGKTTFIIKLLENMQTLFSPPPADILYAYGQYSSAVPKIESMGFKTHEGALTDEELRGYRTPLLLIYDDLLANVSEEYLENLFTKKTHHLNIGKTIFNFS